MDLEYLLRACWRRKMLILAWMAVFAVLLGLGASKLLPLKYSSTAEIVVYPGDLNKAANQVYAVSPDRYVATQVATIDSPRSIAAVAQREGLTVPTVTTMVSVSQTPDTDVIVVKVTSGYRIVNERIANALAQNYVLSVASATADTLQMSVAALNDQISSVQSNIAVTDQELSVAVGDPTLTNSLQSALNGYNTQLQSLSTDLQSTEAGNDGVMTHMVSSGASGVSLVGYSQNKLIVLGALLGLVIGLAHVAITAGPSRSLENLDAVSEVDGIPVLGVIRSRRSRPSWLGRVLAPLPVWSKSLSRLGPARAPGPHGNVSEVGGIPPTAAARARPLKTGDAPGLFRLPVIRQGAVPTVSDLRITQEIAFTLRIKGQIAVLPIGPHDIKRKVVGALELLLGEKYMKQTVLSPTGEIRDAIVVVPMSAMVAGDVSESTLPTYLAVDIAHVRPKELMDLITTLRSTGAAVLGVIGLR